MTPKMVPLTLKNVRWFMIDVLRSWGMCHPESLRFQCQEVFELPQELLDILELSID